MVPLVGIEPTCREAHDFESCVSTSSTTAAYVFNAIEYTWYSLFCQRYAILYTI